MRKMTVKKKIITIGEAMGLFVADQIGNLEDVDKFTRYIAGAEFNVCVGLARLNHDAYYVTMVGHDPIGKFIKKFIEKENIKSDFVYENDKSFTGIMMKERTLTGDPYVASFRKGSAASKLSLEYFTNFQFDSFDLVHLSGIFLALSPETKAVSHFFVDEARKNGKIITFDPNLRFNLWESQEEMKNTINELAFKCDIIMPGIAEGKILTGSDQPEEIANFYLSNHAKLVVIKLGEKGAYVKGIDQPGMFVSGFKVDEVIDTVGAGDGFAVGVISGLVEGLSIEDAVTRGNAIGAIQLSSPSDNEGLPTKEQIDQFILSQRV